MRGLLLLVALSACPSDNARTIAQGYVHYDDIEWMGPRIWQGRSAGRKGLVQVLATESHAFGAPGRVDVVVVEVGDLDEEMAPMAGERVLVRVDVTGAEPAPAKVDLPMGRSEVFDQSVSRPTTRVLHTGTEASAIATGRLDGQLREGALALYRGGSWEVFDVATYEVRVHDDQVVAHTIEGIRLLQGGSWTPVGGDVLGPADAEGFVTLSFEPGLVTVDHRDWSGAVQTTVATPVLGDVELFPVGVVDNGTPDAFVAVLSDCDVPIGELWRFEDGSLEPVRPSRLGALQPGRDGSAHALDSFDGLPGEPSFREVRDGELDGWIDSRTFWGHDDEWGCVAAQSDDSPGRCKPRPVTAPAIVDPSGSQIVMVSIDQTDSSPRVHLRQQALPWADDPTGAAGCDDSRCVDPDDPDNPNSACVYTTLDPTNYTCVPPGSVAEGQRFFNGLPFTSDPLAVQIEPADLDDEPVWVEPHVCGKTSLISAPAEYEAEVHGVTRLDLSSPGYSPISVQGDPAWLDGEELILNRGELVGPIDETFYAYGTPFLTLVASESYTWSYSAARGEWRAVEGVDPALPLQIRTVGLVTLLRNVDDQTWFLDGSSFVKLSNSPIDYDRIIVDQEGWWLSFDNVDGTHVHFRGTTRYTWSGRGFGAALHHDVSPGGDTINRILEDGSVMWHKNRPEKTEPLLPSGWFKPGYRVRTLYPFNSVNPSPVALMQPTIPMSEDGDCLVAPGGCTLTYLYDGRETALSTDAIAFAKHREAAVWVDSRGVHRGTDGLVQTDAALGVPDTAASLIDLIAFCRGSRCQIYRSDAWPMTEVTGWDDGDLKTVRAVDQRYFLFESDTRTIRYDVTTNDLTVVDGSAEKQMANRAGYLLEPGRGAFSTFEDEDIVFARGDVGFAAVDDLHFPTCIPFSQVRYVDGVPDGRELLCAVPPSR